jgi:hypothetical protein
MDVEGLAKIFWRALRCFSLEHAKFELLFATKPKVTRPTADLCFEVFQR